MSKLELAIEQLLYDRAASNRLVGFSVETAQQIVEMLSSQAGNVPMVKTGIEAAAELADYMKLRGIGDEGDAANVIHMLYERGWRAQAESEPKAKTWAEAAGDVCRRERDFFVEAVREHAAKDHSPPVSEPLIEALRPFAECPYASVSDDFNAHEICKGVVIADLKRARAAIASFPREDAT